MLEKTLITYSKFLTHCDDVIKRLAKYNSEYTDYGDKLEDLCLEAGLKGRKQLKAQEHYTWNVRVIRGQQENMENCKKSCQQSLNTVSIITHQFMESVIIITSCASS